MSASQLTLGSDSGHVAIYQDPDRPAMELQKNSLPHVPLSRDILN